MRWVVYHSALWIDLVQQGWATYYVDKIADICVATMYYAGIGKESDINASQSTGSTHELSNSSAPSMEHR